MSLACDSSHLIILINRSTLESPICYTSQLLTTQSCQSLAIKLCQTILREQSPKGRKIDNNDHWINRHGDHTGHLYDRILHKKRPLTIKTGEQ